MAKFCGGVALGEGLKLLNGVICDADAVSVDVAKAITTCGQLWDSNLFSTATVDGVNVITLHHSEGEEITKPIKVKGNCGVGLDGRFFSLKGDKVYLQDGFVLTVITDPEDATVKVVDAEGAEVVSVGEGHYLLSDIGDAYTITVSKEGYTEKSQTVTNNGDQTVTIKLEQAATQSAKSKKIKE